MIPLLLTLALAFVSFISSVFVILRTLLPILPPHPLSRRVPPSEFGLPNYKSLAPADKTHLWLAACDLLALAIFIWQVVSETLGGPQNVAIASDPLAAVRLWFATTLKISGFFVIVGITLLHVRLGRPVVFGISHWLIWAPALVLIVISTSVSGVLAGARFPSLFIGIAAYSSALTVLSTVAFVGLVATLIIIRKNLTAVSDEDDVWPPMRQVEQKPRPSFATEDIDAMKDGSSWITSNASSRAGSISAFSFSTHTHHTAVRGLPVPPVPRIPSPYRPTSPTSASVCDDPDPFHRTIGKDARIRMGSQCSWLTEPSVTQSTMTAWSFPQSSPGTAGDHPSSFPSPFSTVDLNAELLPRSGTPAISSVQVLGGYGYSADSAFAEKGFAGLSAVPEGDLDLPARRIAVWLIHLWVPLAFSLPYVLSVALYGSSSTVASIFLVLSVTLSAPLLALNMIFHCPLPVPAGLFNPPTERPTDSRLARSSSPTILSPWSHEYKRSGSVTVVEGRRSGDVWLTNGDAIDGKRKMGRALEMLNSKPKLSVLPLEDSEREQPFDGELTPPLPIQEPATVPPTPQSEISAELGRHRKESKASSYFSGTDDSVAYATKIMVAQRHYSALATTMVVPPSPGPDRTDLADNVSIMTATGTDVEVARTPRNHLRSRSLSSVSAPRSAISPPPSFPLPPTPPSVKASRAVLGHKRSSSGFSFGAVMSSDLNEIDALSAGVLPLLIPGLKIGQDVNVREDWGISTSKSSTTRGRKARRGSMAFPKELPGELGGLTGEFSSPEVHSTPAVGKKPRVRTKKVSGHKRHHFSLPSLSLGKDGVHALSTWRHDLNRALDDKVLQDPLLPDVHRDTITDEQRPETRLAAVPEDEELLRPSSPTTNNAHLRPTSSATDMSEVARSSLATLIDALDNEFQMPLAGAADSTMFNFDDESGPQAQSTPYDSKKPSSHEPTPPLPKASRRSSIVYIKSDENSRTTRETTTSSPRRIVQWSSQAIKPLVSKPGKLRGKLSSMSNNENAMPSPGGALRALSLLQDRDTNRSAAVAVVEADNSKTRPLALRKKQTVVTDENAVQPPSKSTKKIKSLKLARSDTTNMRAILRKEEVLPEVVVRPPSASDHAGFRYDFRQ